jgi:hypothetical protein
MERPLAPTRALLAEAKRLRNETLSLIEANQLAIASLVIDIQCIR